MLKLAYGCTKALPDGVTAAWGARWIWPADMVWDRQDVAGAEAARSDLTTWLNDGPLIEAMTKARRLAQTYELSPTSDEIVTLYEDDRGIVKASPQSSHGYLYVAAWRI